MQLALVQQLSPDGFARTSIEQHVVGQYDSSTAVNLEQRLDVLDEVELLVRCGRPEVVAFDHIFFCGALAIGAFNLGAALFSERRVGQHDVEALARIGRQGVGNLYWHVLFGADAVQQQVHRAHACRGLHQLITGEGRFLEVVHVS